MDAMNALLTRVPRFHIYPRFHARTALTSMPTESKEQVREESKHADVPAVDEKADRQVSEVRTHYAALCCVWGTGEYLFLVVRNGHKMTVPMQALASLAPSPINYP